MIGLSSNFISEIVSTNQNASSALVGTLSVSCIAVLYCVISYVLYVDDILPFLINAAAEFLVLIAVIVVAVVIGKPISYLNCEAIGTLNSGSSAFDLTTALGNNGDQDGNTVNFNSLIAESSTNCLETTSIWGLSIALCVLFSFSCVCSAILWKRKPVLASEKLDLES